MGRNALPIMQIDAKQSACEDLWQAAQRPRLPRRRSRARTDAATCHFWKQKSPSVMNSGGRSRWIGCTGRLETICDGVALKENYKDIVETWDPEMCF